MLKMCAKRIANSVAYCWKMRAGIWCGPVALLGSKLCSYFPMSFSVMCLVMIDSCRSVVVTVRDHFQVQKLKFRCILFVMNLCHQQVYL